MEVEGGAATEDDEPEDGPDILYSVSPMSQSNNWSP